MEFENAAATLHVPLPRLVIYPDGAQNLTYDTSLQKWVPRGSAADGRVWNEEIFAMVEEVQQRDRWAGIIVGGCCKTTPRDIAALKRRFEERKGSRN